MADKQRIVIRHQILGHKGGRDRHLKSMSKLTKSFYLISNADAMTCKNQRPLRLRKPLKNVFYISRIANRNSILFRRVAFGILRERRSLHIQRNVEQYRSRTSAAR
jgi:hypothetical protein